jgi:hypothetical protein
MLARPTITCEIQNVASEQAIAVVNLSDDLALADSGLDSLCLAIVAARLEDKLGVDPFTASEDTSLPVPVGDFVKAYEDATS